MKLLRAGKPGKSFRSARLVNSFFLTFFGDVVLVHWPFHALLRENRRKVTGARNFFWRVSATTGPPVAAPSKPSGWPIFVRPFLTRSQPLRPGTGRGPGRSATGPRAHEDQKIQFAKSFHNRVTPLNGKRRPKPNHTGQVCFHFLMARVQFAGLWQVRTPVPASLAGSEDPRR